MNNLRYNIGYMEAAATLASRMNSLQMAPYGPHRDIINKWLSMTGSRARVDYSAYSRATLNEMAKEARREVSVCQGSGVAFKLESSGLNAINRQLREG